MRKVSLLLLIVTLLLSSVYFIVPQGTKASFNLSLFDGKKEDNTKEVFGQIDNYKYEITPTAIPEADIAFETENDAEFENAEDTEEIVVSYSKTKEPATEEEYMIGQINEYRASLDLYAVVMDAATCGFATTRAQELENDYSHDGFRKRVESNTLPYSSYSKVTENISENYSYQEVVDAWIASPGHAENMRADTPYVCVKGYGNHYAYQGWKP